jgi:head-tail adaptor
MGFVASGIGVAQKRHRVTLDTSTTTPDGDGGYVEAFAPLDPPALSVNIRSAGAGDLERLQAGTVSATATHVLTGDHHPGITTKTRITFGARHFSVVGVTNPEEGRAEVDIFCAEQIQ